MDEKRCPVCGGAVQRPRLKYCSTACAKSVHDEQTRKSGREYYRRNAEARREVARVWREQNPDALLQHRLNKYNLTVSEYLSMLADQGGGCAICRAGNQDGAWHVDHDHACCPKSLQSCGGCVRGLLCRRCNTALGHFSDSPELLESAARYLRGVGA